MDDAMKALAERAVACKGWRWMEGMADQYRGRIVIAYVDGEVCRFDRSNWDDLDARRPGGLLPDLTDPATLGCLLALVREAWGPDLDIFGLHYHCDGGWCVEVYDRHFYGLTPAEALVNALEAAP